MHGAPSVSYPVARSRFALALLALAWSLGLAAVAAWAWQAAAPGWRQAGAGFVLVLCGAIALREWTRVPAGRLTWDGAAWAWETGVAREAGQAGAALDLQARMLLHWAPEAGRGRWLWLEQRSAPSDWEALRRAVYSRARTGAPA
jgi:toxin CptA